MASSPSPSTTSPSLMDTLFQRTLDDLIKALRHHQTGDSSLLISKATEEIRREIKSTDLHTKSAALQKLSYLNSLHFVDMSWAAFHAIECISSSTFAHKQTGYRAISQSFNDSTPVMLLITNQLRKDLKSGNEFEVSLALESLARIGSVDLCRDLTPEVFTLMSSSKVFVRKKALGVVLRVFAKYPDAVRVCFKRLVESLESSDSQVVSVVIGVFCELASKDPRSYLPLAPEFFKVLVDSRNNWVLIKVLKIFAKLAPLEPRLAKRVVEPICEHMRRTGAKSLVFECVRTLVSSFTEYESAVKLAVVKIREFLVDDDPNLKYLGLHALSIIAPKCLWAVVENKEVVIKSLSDEDPNTKLESLHLVMSMVSEDSVVEICRVLVNYALKSDPIFCNEILGSILSTCSRNVYEIIVDFDWYVSLLGEMSRIPNCQKGEEIESQLIDIGMRVKDARGELVRVGRELLIDPALLGNLFLHRILAAAAWVCGEYVEYAKNPFEIMEALLQPRTNLLPSSTRIVYLHSSFKVLIFCLRSYLLQSENISNGRASEVSGLASKIECLESSDLSKNKAPAHSDHAEGFNRRDSSALHGDSSNFSGLTSNSGFLGENSFTQKSIVDLLNLTELGLGSLTASFDVEIQERARNVLGFLDLIKPEIYNYLPSGEANLETEGTKASEYIDLMYDAFSEELGPVSLTAQERVPIPDGLMLKQNLADLEEICGDIKLPTESSFSTANPYYTESVGFPYSTFHSSEEPEPSSESTLLLAEHRKRHGLYYLPAEKNEIPANDYPPANDPSSGVNTNDDAQDLVKLTDQSLIPKRKSNQSKPRPMVVKLDEGEVAPMSGKQLETEENLLSGAIRDILLGNEAKLASNQNLPSDKSSSKRKGKEKLNPDLPESRGDLAAGEMLDPGNPGLRRSKHRGHGKEKSKKSSEKKNVDEGEDSEKKEKQKIRHHHGRHKTRQKANTTVNVVPQTQVIPDFLL